MDVFAAIGKLCVQDILARGQEPDKINIAKYTAKVAWWLTSADAKPCLILAGNAGTGKTTIMRAVNKMFNLLGIYSKFYISATALNDNFQYNQEDSIRHFCEGDGCTWLLLDDMGEEPTEIKEYGNAKSPVIRVVAGRYDRMLPIMVTTNLNMEALEAKYGNRTADRLKEVAEWVPFSGASYRK